MITWTDRFGVSWTLESNKIQSKVDPINKGNLGNPERKVSTGNNGSDKGRVHETVMRMNSKPRNRSFTPNVRLSLLHVPGSHPTKPLPRSPSVGDAETRERSGTFTNTAKKYIKKKGSGSPSKTEKINSNRKNSAEEEERLTRTTSMNSLYNMFKRNKPVKE